MSERAPDGRRARQAPLGAGDTVLVTGAAGGIGRYVVGACVDAGLRVIATDRVPFADDRAAGCPVGDIRDADFVASCLLGPDGPVAGVAHLAAIPAPGQVSEEETLDQNVLGSFVVLQQAGRHGVRRVVLASSVSAFGLAWADRDLSPRYVPVDEDHPTMAVDCYGLSKVLAEEVAAFSTRRWGLPTVCLRFPFVGTGDRLTGQLARVHEDPGGHRRDLWAWLDTRDAARAVRAGLTEPLSGHHVISVSADDTSALQPTEELLRAHHPDSRLTRRLPAHSAAFDNTRAREILGFRPHHPWRDERPPHTG
ncbi:NAD(P)-dependent oxidoreductase [Streptomyces sp. NBRC 109706]|uniref:NAD-dependent epimerase/dehydratase family protein n=1 Tax=Streptomyces sp. NBRC 109706 TaxID=1550035 RepID=UPI0007854643|nr:NAD(P)-dependent oxidoreductase [Streptomyces sp. NBRC 109706]